MSCQSAFFCVLNVLCFSVWESGLPCPLHCLPIKATVEFIAGLRNILRFVYVYVHNLSHIVCLQSILCLYWQHSHSLFRVSINAVCLVCHAHVVSVLLYLSHLLFQQRNGRMVDEDDDDDDDDDDSCCLGLRIDGFDFWYSTSFSCRCHPAVCMPTLTVALLDICFNNQRVITGLLI